MATSFTADAYLAGVLACTPDELVEHLSKTESQRRQWNAAQVDIAFTNATGLALLPLIHSRLISTPSTSSLDLLLSWVAETSPEVVISGQSLLLPIVNTIVDTCQANDVSPTALSVLHAVLHACRRHAAELTPIHAPLVRLALHMRQFELAAQIADQPINSIGQVDTLSYLLYHYYCGIMYTALEEYESATYCFEICLTTPASTLSHVQLAAFKKYILVSLIHCGKMTDAWSALRSPCIYRMIREQPNIVAYEGLVDQVVKQQSDQLQQFVTKHQAEYEKDGNAALITRVLTSITSRRIHRNVSAFNRISVESLSTRVACSSTDVCAHIASLVEKGVLRARIVDGVVHVDGEGDAGRNGKPCSVKALHELNVMLSGIDNELATNVEYVNRLAKKTSKAGGTSSSTPAWNEG